MNREFAVGAEWCWPERIFVMKKHCWAQTLSDLALQKTETTEKVIVDLVEKDDLGHTSNKMEPMPNIALATKNQRLYSPETWW